MERVILSSLLALACLRCDAQTENKVTQEKVEQTSKRRVTLAIPGRPPNQKASLRVECLHTEETVQFVVEETDQFTVVLDAGPAEVHSIGIVSGAGASMIDEAVPLGLDALLTGEPAEHTMADAREGGIHFIAAGHYATETFGIRRLGELVADRFAIDHEFIEVPNPI